LQFMQKFKNNPTKYEIVKTTNNQWIISILLFSSS
jgi:hypothetical protein